MFITFLLFGNDVISLESRSVIFIYLYTRTQSIRKEIVQYNIKSKYPEEYSTVDKVGREKLLARKSCHYILLHCYLAKLEELESRPGHLILPSQVLESSGFSASDWLEIRSRELKGALYIRHEDIAVLDKFFAY